MELQEWKSGDKSISQLEHIIALRKIGSWKSYLWEWSDKSYKQLPMLWKFLVTEILSNNSYEELPLLDS